jgi:hypothetical protein
MIAALIIHFPCVWRRTFAVRAIRDCVEQKSCMSAAGSRRGNRMLFRHYLEPLIVAAQLAYYTDAAQESSIRHKENQA